MQLEKGTKVEKRMGEEYDTAATHLSNGMQTPVGEYSPTVRLHLRVGFLHLLQTFTLLLY